MKLVNKILKIFKIETFRFVQSKNEHGTLLFRVYNNEQESELKEKINLGKYNEVQKYHVIIDKNDKVIFAPIITIQVKQLGQDKEDIRVFNTLEEANNWINENSYWYHFRSTTGLFVDFKNLNSQKIAFWSE